ncbi:magnesium transporter MRS2-F-like [Macadamia integrifolia]|uniref:magnesium transporter MRS2-F-like n=1 Tax=Macadamia integrifolia TaxID=60698 RepID=UPI001C4F6526|nr:magnesium transporter MRS2-F-like [Macadamia integrifolia]
MSPKRPTTAATPPHPRRKGAGIRAWLVVSNSGNSHVEEVGKHSIMRRTGLPARDMRILDPGLSYPSTILGRERAIVVNLEHIKAIITASEVLVLNSKDPWVVPFIRDLESRLCNFNEKASEGRDGDTAKEVNGVLGPKSPETDQNYPLLRQFSLSPEIGMVESNENGSPMASGDKQLTGGPKVLPFEFCVLEICLESACRSLEAETSTLEKEAYPALDELTSKTSTYNLQRVRHIKSRLVAVYGRVQKVRDELENLLDDDMDMAEMYLTDKLSLLQFEESGLKDELDKDYNDFESDDECNEELRSDYSSSSGKVTGFKPNIQELEMLLEAYFVQIGGTLNKLSTLREYVDDTEDYINIMLDDKQNQLLQMGVMLSTATLLFTAGVVVVGVFGMNIKISLFNTGMPQFLETNIGVVGGIVVLYLSAFYWGKQKGLLD